MAVLGHDVVGFDVDADKVARLAKNDPPFFEPGLEDLLAAALATGRLRFTTSYAEAAEHGEIHFLCVGTPQRGGLVERRAGGLPRQCGVDRRAGPAQLRPELGDVLPGEARPGHARHRQQRHRREDPDTQRAVP